MNSIALILAVCRTPTYQEKRVHLANKRLCFTAQNQPNMAIFEQWRRQLENAQGTFKISRAGNLNGRKKRSNYKFPRGEVLRVQFVVCKLLRWGGW